MLLYFVLAISIGLLIRKRYINNPLYKKFFIPGLVVKLLGGITFGLIHTYYFTYGGDTKTYFHDMDILTSYFFQDPFATLSYLFNKYSYLNGEIIRNTVFAIGTKEFFLVRIATFINILGLNSYWSTTILFASFSFVGTWQLFLVFANKYPAIWKQMAWAALFLPSFVFWGSGIMKDTLAIGFLGIFLYSVNHIYEKGKLNLWYIFLIGLSVFIILSVRAYIVFGLLPAMMIWVSLGLKDKIRNPLMKMVFMPFMIVIMLAGVTASFFYLGKYNSQFSVDNVIGTAWSYQHWHYVEGQNTSEQHGRGSSYTLGEYDPTPIGVMKKFFPAVNAALYRPYFWEVKNPAMAILALESFAFFLFTLYIILKVGPFVLFRAVGKDSFLLMSLVFSVFFSFAVGFSTYNFGALARYKIPALPFFALSLLVLNYYANYYRDLRKKGKATRNFGAAIQKDQVKRV